MAKAKQQRLSRPHAAGAGSHATADYASNQSLRAPPKFRYRGTVPAYLLVSADPYREGPILASSFL